MRGISPLVTSKLLYFDAMRGISLSSHRIHFISTQQGGYPFSSRQNVLFRRDEGGDIPLVSNPFYFDTTRGNILSCRIESFPFQRDEGGYPSCRVESFPFRRDEGDILLLTSNPFHFDMTRGNIPSRCVESFLSTLSSR